MYLNEQIPMVCLGCLENKYFSRHLMFGFSKKDTEPSGSAYVLKDVTGVSSVSYSVSYECKVYYLYSTQCLLGAHTCHM